MNKKITIVLLSLVLLIGGFVSGFMIGDSQGIKISETDRFEVLYGNLDSKTQNEIEATYNSILKAETSPSEVKYVMEIAMKNADEKRKNELLAQYLNHTQYYMTTYSDFVAIYQTIMKNMRDSVDFESPDSYKSVSDNVLSLIIEEIYASDMQIKMPSQFDKEGVPYIIVNYDKIKEEYKDILNAATTEYIEFKEIAQRGELSGENGEYDMDKIGEYLIKANNYIVENPDYPLVADVIYSYILASKMYIGIYNVSEPFMPSETEIEKYKAFKEKYPETPISSILNELIGLYEAGELVSMEHVTTWNNTIELLLGEN